MTFRSQRARSVLPRVVAPRVVVLSLLVVLVAALLAWPATATPPDGLDVPGFRQILPRGSIEALVDPPFVPADEAEIPAGAWVLGYVHGGSAGEGQAFAYDLNLLSSHEVVNHGVHDTESDAASRFAAVW